jgi:serine O-acetyltransferase
MKIGFRRYFIIEKQINIGIKISKFIYFKLPVLGKFISTMIIDRMLLLIFGIDLLSHSIHINKLSISHPNGILLGGNGIRSEGRVVIMSGVKFGAKTPKDPLYLELHSSQSVFILGDNVVISSNSVILGPITICDNVIISAMSLVNKSISEPGIYGGIPVKKLSNNVNQDWVEHL